MAHEPCQILPETIDVLRASITASIPHNRTGAAYVSLDTRVLAALIQPERVAAPQLLAALRDMLTAFDDAGWTGNAKAACDNARAAIARAEGR